jgi:perosamine synthetase
VVATSPLTFMASANCARYVGASVALVDIERRTLNLDPTRVPDDARGFVPVHYAGLPVELERLPTRPDILIEDAAHALGASTPDGPIGNCARSDACVFSFHPVKPITTGEGGAITTNDDGLADELRRFRNHGITRTPEEGGWTYRIDRLGHNLRITDLQAALGWSQLGRLDAFIARRNELAERYRALLAGWPLILPPAAPDGTVHGYHLFAVQVEGRRAVHDALHAEGIRAQVHYVPVHHHPIGAHDRRPAEGLPVCDEVYAGILSLPLHPSLTDAQQDRVVAALERALGR